MAIISDGLFGGKACSKCGIWRPYADYGKQQGKWDERQTQCRHCKAADARARRAADPEGMRAYQREWARKQPEKAKERERRFRERNREVLNRRARERRHRNPEHENDVQRRWKARNTDYVNACTHLRRARIYGNGGRWTPEEWAALKKAQEYRCLMCGRQEPEIQLTLDHVVPLSKGGSNSIDNIQGLCRPCNSRKHDKTIDLRPAA